ncbi:MAG: CvpA family protein [Ruminococcaceae bacterium]|nr:CvpA family protein [Oscillospiraceae bacterium]
MAKRIIISALVTLLLGGVGYYISLPPLHIKSSEFWGFLIYIIVVFLVCFFFSGVKKILKNGSYVPKSHRIKMPKTKKMKIIVLSSIAIVIVGFLAIFISSSEMFNAKDYRNLLKVEERDFNEDISEISLSQIPVVDKDTATRLGSRKIGEVVELVSQFNVSDFYTQINYKSAPTRVSPLDYADIIKWISNRSEGIPYYVKIDMATQDTELVKLEIGMKYTPGEFFSRDLMRHVRFSYPTKMFESVTFEIDDNGHPYWNVSYYDYTIGFLGGRDITGIIMVDAVTGEMKNYPVADVPQWVDTVYDSQMLIEQADLWGAYTNGFWNSIFGQKNVVQTTDGYNYLALDDDVWMYTGITSVVDDASNIGFLLVNLRTKEARQYTMNGAEEYSAMESAEGMIQEKNYIATFPILVNIADTPSYFISLKDNAGLVKAYSFVSVTDYQIVGVADTIAGADAEYRRLLKDIGGVKEEEKPEPVTTEVTITVEAVSSAVVDGNTVYYIKSTDGKIYTVGIGVSSNLPFIKAGDVIKATVNSENNAIKSIN